MDNKAFTFDDIVILPAYSDIEREDVDIPSWFHWNNLRIPIFSSPMDTITEARVMFAMRLGGGLGFHHRYCDLEQLIYAATSFNGGIAVAPSMGIDTVLEIVDKQYPLVMLDVAHGHTKKNLDFCAELVKNGCIVVSGNVVTREAIRDYLNIGIKDFRVGVGSGSVCTTRTVGGVGIPQASAIKLLREAFQNDITIISDGGHKTTGDIVKALALGADFVMLGGMLAGCDEVPELGKTVYQGMG